MKLGNRLLISVGFAQGLMTTVWSLVFDRGTGYFYDHYPRGLVIAAYLLMPILVAIVFACTYLPAKVRWAALVPTLVMLDDLRWGLGLSMKVALPLAVIILVVLAFLVQKKKATWMRIGMLGLELLGFAGIVVPLAGLTLLKSQSYPSKATILPSKSHRRIVLAIFDELDPVHALTQWPRGYPENPFQALANRSLNFTTCFQPGPETMYSLPAMTIGHTIDRAKPANDSVLNLIVGGQKRTWNEKPNVLLEARDTIGASVLGWYHPYSRLFEGIDGHSFERIDDGIAISFWAEFDMLIQRPFRLFHASSETVFYREELATWQRQIIEKYHQQIPEFIQSHDGLILLHIPCPHRPFVMDPIEDDPLGSDVESYYGQVRYAGTMLGTVESSLRSTGDPYTLIVTSDHNLRIPLNGFQPCGRVPMMVVGTTIRKPQQVARTAYGEHVADVIRVLMGDPTASEDAIVETMTKPRASSTENLSMNR